MSCRVNLFSPRRNFVMCEIIRIATESELAEQSGGKDGDTHAANTANGVPFLRI